MPHQEELPVLRNNRFRRRSIAAQINDLTVPLVDVDDLHNRDGNLQVGAC